MTSFKLWLENLSQDEVRQFRDALEAKYGVPDIWITYFPQYNRLHLDSLIVPKAMRNQGIGSKIVQEIIDFAHSHGYCLTLTPGVKDKNTGTTSQSRLKRFYGRLGFKKNKDYRFSSSMINKPPTP